MTRPPTVGGRSYGRGPLPTSGSQLAASQPAASQPAASQPAASQLAAFQSGPTLSDQRVANSEPSDDREEIAIVGRGFRTLHPSRRNGAKWFKHNTEVSTGFRKTIEGCFKGPWYSWKKVPLFYRDAWFSTFKTKFEWDASIENLVKANFETLASARLRGMISLAKSKKEKPEWILSEHWKIMSEYWRTEPAKDKSAKARASRLSPRDGLGAHCHRGGSRSYLKHQDIMEANNEDSSFIAVLRKTHQKSDGSFVDERAQLIAEKYDECVQQRLSWRESSNGESLTVDDLTLEEKNEIYKQIVGTSKQGCIFGLGSLYSGVLTSVDCSVSSQANEVGTLTRQVEGLEIELQNSREETAVFKKRLESLEDLCFNPNSN